MKEETMRIAMLGQKAVPSRAGGVEVVVEALATRMVAAGHQVTCYNRKGGLTKTHYQDVVLKQVPTVKGRGLAAVSSSFFAALYASLSNAQIVHIHAEGPALMSWIPKLFGKTVVVTIHGLDWQRAKWGKGLGARYILLGEKTAVRFADSIIVLSRNLQRYFADTYHRETVLIPNGVEQPEKSVHPVPFGLQKDGYFLFMGRLVPEKGIHTLIEAFVGCHTDKKLVIAGESSDSDGYVQSLRTLAEKDSRILFIGFAGDGLRQTLYANAYCYVQPSQLEGMSLSLLEAMRYGNCCIVSDIPECREVVETAAVVVPVGDSGALRKQLQRLCDSPEEVQLYKEAAACLAAEKPDWGAVTEKTLEVYRKALGGTEYADPADQ